MVGVGGEVGRGWGEEDRGLAAADDGVAGGFVIGGGRGVGDKGDDGFADGGEGAVAVGLDGDGGKAGFGVGTGGERRREGGTFCGGGVEDAETGGEDEERD